MSICRKKWTILMYLNGNNELEPEIWQSWAMLQTGVDFSDLHIVGQIGREESKVVQILRSVEQVREPEERWSGVRRFYLEGSKPILVRDFHKINMADPNVLYDFLLWGMREFAAEHYMVILGGHGFQYVGVLLDYNGDSPTIMGIPEMCTVMGRIKEETGKVIDLLILDICYMNQVEVMYEFGRDAAVQYVITYIQEGPLEGLPYGLLGKIVQANSLDEPVTLIKEIIKQLNRDLVAVEIIGQKLSTIKQAFHEFAYRLLCEQGTDPVDLPAVIADQKTRQSLKILQELICSIVVAYKRVENYDEPLLEVADFALSHMNYRENYCRLAFAENNYWTTLLVQKSVNDPFEERIDFRGQPVTLHTNIIEEYINMLYPYNDQNEITSMYEKLKHYKGWT